MGRRSKRKRSGSGDVDENTEDGEDDDGTSPGSMIDLSAMLQVLEPELRGLLADMNSKKQMSNKDLKRILSLMLSEFCKFLPLATKTSEKVQELLQQKRELEDENRFLEEEKSKAKSQNETLKEHLVKNQTPSVIIKNLPIHECASGITEATHQTKSQFKKLLASMKLQSLDFKSVHRMQARPNSSPSKPLSVVAEFHSFNQRKTFMKGLFLLRRSEFSGIQAQPKYPVCFSGELKQKENLAFLIRKNLKTRTRIILRSTKLQIQFKCENVWVNYDEEEESDTQIISYKNMPWPKKSIK